MNQIPRATVIIATYNRGAVLLDTIRYALRSDYPDLEVIVVDQTASYPEPLASELESLRLQHGFDYVKLTKPNLPYARNVGIQRATGDIIIFCDDDVAFGPDYVANHVRVYEDPQVGAVAGRVTTPDDKLWVADASGNVGRVNEDGSFSANFQSTERRDCDWGPGCNMSFRRSVLMEAGGFDERFGALGYAYREDGAAFARTKAAGYRIVFEPSAHLVHLISPSGGCRKDAVVKRMCGFFHNDTLFYLAYQRYYHQERSFARFSVRTLRWIWATTKVDKHTPQALVRWVGAYLQAIQSHMTVPADDYSRKYGQGAGRKAAEQVLAA